MARKKSGEEIVVKNDAGDNIISGSTEGKEVQYSKDFGCGIDVHSRMIQVSVLVRQNLSVFEYRCQFNTTKESILAAKEWVISTIKDHSIPYVDPTVKFHYCLESTSTYHFTVVKLWDGVPSIINPSLARAGKKKTDVLDAKTLAIADLTGVWPESYVPDDEVVALRLLVDERKHYVRMATQISNRIYNSLLKLGICVGTVGSVTGNNRVRSDIETHLQDNHMESTDDAESILPDIVVPDEAKCIFVNEFAHYDYYRNLTCEFKDKIRDKIYSMSWETGNDTISGRKMMEILTSAPGIGDQTAALWLTRVVTPRRFRNEKALAAYCGCDPSLKVSAGKVTSTVKRGGRHDLHSSLCSAASNLMRIHNEPFGRFGYNIAMQTGIWKKGVSAVARKLAVAMYYMSLRNEKFSYEKYKMVQEPTVIDIPIETLAKLNHGFKRYLRFMFKENIYTTKQLVHAYFMCTLNDVKGCGKNFFSLTKDFIENQDKYNELYKEFTKNENNEK